MNQQNQPFHSSFLYFSFLVGSAVGWAACSSSAKDQNTTTKTSKSGLETSTPSPTRLTREQAVARSKMISQVTYALDVDLTGSSEEFQAKAILQFNLKAKARELDHSLLVDFEGGKISSILVNEVSLSDMKSSERFDGHHLFFRSSELRPTGNKIEISYSHPYSHDGRGLHRFQDPVDGNSYLYSHFEPYDAHRMFPCFDQPDLKATYELHVTAPSGWQVISNTLPNSVSDQGQAQSWIFPKSQTFSTYLFALHAGPYAVWKGQADTIPLRLFARKSLANYVDYQEWLKITEQGLDYFGTQFAYPYPFKKYDQVLVPDFNAGAMENVGAVTFSEGFVFRSKVTQDQKRRRADTILHEMAHMWFGDLVTMKWWNGLWLNESFATFMAAKAVDQATDFKGTWQDFFSGNKQWAYWEDQLVTTHPIENPVIDTDVAESIFDGITYGKGASVLKQLQAYIGEDEFREGVQRYFQKHAFKNTTLSDFFKKLAEASGADLGAWEKAWLQTSGVNTLKVDWQCEVDPETEKSILSKFDLIQTSTNQELRPHRTKIEVYESKKNRGRSQEVLTAKTPPSEITYAGAKTSVHELVKKPCPSFVFPNHDDYDYVKVELDPLSLQKALSAMGSIQDSLTRQMLWHTLWEMVLDGKLKAQSYAEAVLKFASQEKDTLILSKILQHLAQSSLQTSSVVRFLDGDLRAEYQRKIETFTETQLMRASAGTDLQLIWYRAFLNAAHSEKAITALRRLLEGRSKLRAFKIDQERRWEIIQTLASRKAPEVEKLIAAELKNDPTDFGQKFAIAAETSIPEGSVKKKWENLFIEDHSTLPISKLRVAMRNFHLLNQETLSEGSVDYFFENLPKLARRNLTTSDELVKNFAHSMFPALCEPKMIERTTLLLDSHPELSAEVVKSLKIHRQEEERCIRARSLAKKPN